MHILKRFEFEPSLMRSGVVAVERSHGKRVSTGVLIVKGAAPAIEQQIGADRLPPNYRKVTIAVMIVMSVPLLQQRQSAAACEAVRMLHQGWSNCPQATGQQLLDCLQTQMQPWSAAVLWKYCRHGMYTVMVSIAASGTYQLLISGSCGVMSCCQTVVLS